MRVCGGAEGFCPVREVASGGVPQAAAEGDGPQEVAEGDGWRLREDRVNKLRRHRTGVGGCRMSHSVPRRRQLPRLTPRWQSSCNLITCDGQRVTAACTHVAAGRSARRKEQVPAAVVDSPSIAAGLSPSRSVVCIKRHKMPSFAIISRLRVTNGV